MSARTSRWIDVALGEVEVHPAAASERRLLESYERTAARAHLALALEAPLEPPRDLRARLLEAGLRCIAERGSREGAP